ncbi:MAG: hypothetical protein GEV12_02515 [Micromonosporaceae bacterium]|nr:hypothetical protein [Micromonosporaceae bacterium]
MAIRGWGGSVAVAIGVGAAVGAAQLGLGYGLDVISFAPDTGGRLSTEGWVTSLTWATWIAATSTIAGAIVADRLSGRGPATGPATGPAAGWDPASPADPTDPTERADRVTTRLWRLVLATAAALGASATVALVAVPARVAVLDDVPSPQTVAAGYAALGVVVSLLVALAALAARAVAANLLATAAWLWLIAVIAVTGGVLSGRDRARVPLGFWDVTADGPWFRSVLLADAGPPLAAALLIGLLAALPAARRGDRPVGLVGSGAAGPLVLTIAYLLTQPDLVGAGAVDISRHLVVPYLVLAGLLGSLLACAVRARSAPPAARPTDGTPPPVPMTARVPAQRG